MVSKRKALGGLDYIRGAYGVPAAVGMRVRFIDSDTAVRYGTILGGDSHLRVRWDDGGEGHLHPTWHVYYLGEFGDVIWPVMQRGQRAFAPTVGTLLGAGITAAVASVPAGFGWSFGGGWGSEIADQSIRASRFGPPGKLPSEASREVGARVGRRDAQVLRAQEKRALQTLRSAILTALAPHAGSTWRGTPLVTFGMHPPTGDVFVSAKVRLDSQVQSAVDRAATVYGYRLVEARTLGTWSAFMLSPQVAARSAVGDAAGMIMDRGRGASARRGSGRRGPYDRGGFKVVGQLEGWRLLRDEAGRFHLADPETGRWQGVEAGTGRVDWPGEVPTDIKRWLVRGMTGKVPLRGTMGT